MKRRLRRKKDTTPIFLHIIARGKIARSPEAQLVARYEKRLTWPVKLTELPETGGRVPDPQTPCKTVLLDERGKALGSEDFAKLLGRWRDDGMREARFVLGAAHWVRRWPLSLRAKRSARSPASRQKRRASSLSAR